MQNKSLRLSITLLSPKKAIQIGKVGSVSTDTLGRCKSNLNEGFIRHFYRNVRV